MQPKPIKSYPVEAIYEWYQLIKKRKGLCMIAQPRNGGSSVKGEIRFALPVCPLENSPERRSLYILCLWTQLPGYPGALSCIPSILKLANGPACLLNCLNYLIFKKAQLVSLGRLFFVEYTVQLPRVNLMTAWRDALPATGSRRSSWLKWPFGRFCWLRKRWSRCNVQIQKSVCWENICVLAAMEFNAICFKIKNLCTSCSCPIKYIPCGGLESLFVHRTV